MIDGVITEPGVYELTDAEYHADPVKGGSLTSTGARTLLTCPARFRHDLDHGRPDTAAFDFGHAVHTNVLGIGAPIVSIDADDWRSKDARCERDKVRAAGHTPLLVKDAAVVQGMVTALQRHPVAGPLFARPGRAETTLVGRDPETGVMCRARPDWLPNVDLGERVLIVDYKTTKNAHPAAFAKAMADYGYHLQGPFYGDVLTWLELHNGQDPQFVLVAQEKTPPYLVTVGTLSPRAVEWGRVLNRKARDLYRECVATDVWPGYSTEVAVLDIPGWLDYQYSSNYDNGLYQIRGDQR